MVDLVANLKQLLETLNHSKNAWETLRIAREILATTATTKSIKS